MTASIAFPLPFNFTGHGDSQIPEFETAFSDELPANYSVNLFHFPFDPMMSGCSLSTNLARSATCEYPGMGSEATKLLLDGIKVPFQVFSAASLENPLAMIENSTRNCLIVGFGRSKLREMHYQVSSTVFYDSLSAVMTVNSTQADLFGFTTVFKPSTWVLITVVFVAFNILSQLYASTMKSRNQIPQEHAEPLNHICKRCSSTYDDNDNSQSTGRMNKLKSMSIGMRAQNCLTAFTLMTALISSLFESGLLSRLLVKKEVDPFINTITLANFVTERKDIKMLLIPKSGIADNFDEAVQFEPLREAAIENPVDYDSKNAAQFYTKIASGTRVSIVATNTGWSMTSFMPKLRIVLLEDLPPFESVFVCNRNISKVFMDRLNKSILEYKPFLDGLVVRYQKYYTWRYKAVQRSMQLPPGVMKQLCLSETLGIFLIVVAGVSAGAVIFISEVVLEIFKKHFQTT